MFSAYVIHFFIFSMWMKKHQFSFILMHIVHLLHFLVLFACGFLHEFLILVYWVGPIHHWDKITSMIIWCSHKFDIHPHIVKNVIFFFHNLITLCVAVEKTQGFPWTTYWYLYNLSMKLLCYYVKFPPNMNWYKANITCVLTKQVPICELLSFFGCCRIKL